MNTNKTSIYYYLENKYISVSVLVILIIVAIYLGVRFMNSKSTVGVQDKVAAIIAGGDASKCEEAKDKIINGVDYYTICKNNVYLKIARDNLDISVCEKLDNKLASIDVCKKEIITSKIVKANNNSYCESFKDQTDLFQFCQNKYLKQSVLNEETPKNCDSISSAQEKLSCYEIFSRKYITNTKNPNCSILSYPDLINNCQTYKKAIKTKVADTCRLISDYYIYDECNKKIQNK